MGILAALRPDGENLPPARYVAAVARNAWYYRPVITTHQAQLNACTDNYMAGFVGAMDRTKRAAEAESTPSRPHASRMTSTGITLHALGGAA